MLLLVLECQDMETIYSTEFYLEFLSRGNVTFAELKAVVILQVFFHSQGNNVVLINLGGGVGEGDSVLG